MNIRKILSFLVCIFLAGSLQLYAETDICGTYVVQNVIDDYQGTRFFEIRRNRYQEYEVAADQSFTSVAYYDGENGELFCVIETTHQYNTLMKFRIEDGTLTVFSLNNEKWCEYPGEYRKQD